MALRNPLRLAACLASAVLLVLAGSRGPAAQEGPSGAPTGATETQVLHEVCRYLRLSKTQLALLLPTARAADRARARMEPLEAKARELAGQPSELSRAQGELDQARARLQADLSSYAAPQMARVFTREQIALAWRLMGGQPPRYAGASPLLADPHWGFNQPGQYRLREYDLFLGGVRREERELLRLTEDAAGDVLVPLAPSTGIRRLNPGAPDLGARRLPGLEAPAPAPPVEKPFPQLVVETNELKDVLPPLELLARRVYMSPEWLPVLEQAYREGLGVAPSLNHRLVSPGKTRMVRQYRMDRGLRDQAGAGPELEPLGGWLDHGQYVFEAGQGLKLPDIGVRDDYDLELNFRYLGGAGYQKVLDFKKGKQDGGLYVYQGHLTFYTLANGGVPVPGLDHRLRIQRSRKTRVVQVWLDLQPVFSFIDLDDDAVFEDGTALFFVDDVTTKNEQGPGGMRWLSVRGPAAP